MPARELLADRRVGVVALLALVHEVALGVVQQGALPLQHALHHQRPRARDEGRADHAVEHGEDLGEGRRDVVSAVAHAQPHIHSVEERLRVRPVLEGGVHHHAAEGPHDHRRDENAPELGDGRGVDLRHAPSHGEGLLADQRAEATRARTPAVAAAASAAKRLHDGGVQRLSPHFHLVIVIQQKRLLQRGHRPSLGCGIRRERHCLRLFTFLPANCLPIDLEGPQLSSLCQSKPRSSYGKLLVMSGAAAPFLPIFALPDAHDMSTSNTRPSSAGNAAPRPPSAGGGGGTSDTLLEATRPPDEPPLLQPHARAAVQDLYRLHQEGLPLGPAGHGDVRKAAHDG